jgi:hypothetical protein
VLVVLLIVAVAILCGVVVVAMGRGGELAPSAADVRPVDGEIVTAADVALLRPPAALWGYDMRATDEALNMVARTVTERDVEIAILRRQIADLEAAAKEPPPPAKPQPPAKPPSGPLPPPFQHGIGAPRKPADAQQWSAWQRSAPAPSPLPAPAPTPPPTRAPSQGPASGPAPRPTRATSQGPASGPAPPPTRAPSQGPASGPAPPPTRAPSQAPPPAPPPEAGEHGERERGTG